MDIRFIKQAKWISPQKHTKGAAEELRKHFSLKGDIESAKLYITAQGVYEAFLNSRRIGEYILAPGFTSAKKRIQVQEYDVTCLIEPKSKNTLSVLLGEGWCVGKLGWSTQDSVFASETALIACLKITYKDKSEDIITTDNSWESAVTPIIFSGIYDGEIYDARITPDNWVSAVEKACDINRLIPQDGEEIREQEIFAPVRIFTTPKGERVLDFGQNITGYVRFSVCGNAGDKVSLSHAEVLDKEGNFYTDNLRAAKCKIEYTLSGKGKETYQPHFTFQGFRFIRIDDYPGEPDMRDFRAVEVHSSMKRTGSFRCSDERLNRLYHNIIWGQKDNFLDVPTDCPQRDERLGWTGDAQVFCRTAAYNFDVERFFIKWLADLAADQLEDGAVPHVVPNVLKETDSASAAWADAAVICPWQMYVTYGNKAALAGQYDSMKKWVEYQRAHGTEECLWDGGTHFGDWLALDVPTTECVGLTDRDLIATAYFARSAELLAKAAAVLQKDSDAKEYAALHERVAKRFAEVYFKDGKPAVETQTAYALAISFELIDAKAREYAVKRLAEMIIEAGTQLTTGFVGTPLLLKVLSQNGYEGLAYDLLLREDYPGWLYPIEKDATTIWEHWDGIRPDGSMWDKGMNSFNHYAYGAVAEFLYERVAGLSVTEEGAGGTVIAFAPILDERLKFAEAGLVTRQGEVTAEWKRTEAGIEYRFKLPQGSRGILLLPGESAAELGAGVHTFVR